MKTLDAPTLAHFAQETTTLCLAWLVTRRDGVSFGFTSHVADLVWTDPVSPFTVWTLLANTGAGVSNLATSVGRGIDNLTAWGTINSSAITTEDLLRGLYDDASVRVLAINYEDPTIFVELVRGRLGEVKAGRRAFEVEVRSLLQRAAQNVGKVCSPLCRVKLLGDAECTVALGPFTFAGQTVDGVTSRSVFTTSSAGVIGKAAFYFAYGVLTWTSGANIGKSVEVRSHNTSTPCQLTITEIMPFAIQIGDAFTVIAGCDRRLETCRDKFSNVLNFRGEPYIPGADTVLKVISA